MEVKNIDELIVTLSSLQGIGVRSAERMVFEMLQKDSAFKDELSSQISSLNDIKNCKVCNCLSSEDVCGMCKDQNKVSDVLCVVDDLKNIMVFQKNELFIGRYFLLSNLINPIRGIGPDEINFNKLDSMIKKFQVKELFVALKTSVEGETTSLYISKKYKDHVKVTRLAQGIPLGADIEYLDPLTIEQAMRDRKEI